MSSRLPVELYKIIIGNLEEHRDGATLRACSLTCKAFLHASRFIIFRDLHLREKHQFERLVESPTNLCTYVHHLFLYEAGLVLWLSEALPLIATSLQRIRTLSLVSFRWEMLDDTARSALLSGFRHVEELEITSIRFETSAQLNELIASFPSLKNISCEDAYWKTYLVPVIPLPLGITSIILDSFHASFFDQLLSLESHPIVRTVRLEKMFCENLKEVGMLLKKLGSHVEYLALGELVSAFYGNPQARLEDNIDLSHNTNLRSLSLRTVEGSLGDLEFVLWSQITSPHLERIALEIEASMAELAKIDWLRIDYYFYQQRWANLHHLVIVLWGGSRSAKQFIKVRLPLLSHRGTLVVWVV